MFSKADENNPLLSTPVAMIAAHIAAGLAAGAVADTRTFASNLGKEMAARAEMSVTMAELVVQHLQERSHLPRTIAVDEEPKADDATLILQGMMAGIVLWEPYEVGDLRGTLYITGAAHHERFRCVTKLKRGIPEIDDPTRKVLMERLAHTLRHL